jgi:NAD(P)-dependent dehydrogenase (short-subunit alcohol dehydrogenase family)
VDPSIASLFNLDGQVAVVTGAATGIGEGIAKVLAAAGAYVHVVDVDAAGAARVAADIGGKAHRVDVTDTDAIAFFVDELALGNGIDILVNNAGSYHESGSILDQTHESWHRSIDLNLVSVFNCSKPVAKQMVAQERGGSIINIASVDGLLPCLGVGYDTAKAAVIHFTRSLALDLSVHNIRVNGVNPGVVPVPTLERKKSGELPPVWSPGSPTGLMGPLMRIRSSNVPLGRKGTPEDVAHAVLFLASQAASYVTGQTIGVEGGWGLI